MNWTRIRNASVGHAGIVSVLVLLTALAASPAYGAVWYVNGAFTVTAPDGKAWASAYPAIQSAVDVAASGDQVWVAKGTYTGAGGQVVNLKEGVTLYGGFLGNETARDARKWKANPTVIDGQNARRCVTAIDAGVVDGFTIQNGSGGGMRDGTAINCIFFRNSIGSSLDSEQGGGKYGGVAINCIFTENTAWGYGGGMYGTSAINCTFERNIAYDTAYFTPNGYGTSRSLGGGMYGTSATNCTFYQNMASGYTETYPWNSEEDGTALNCIFFENTASGYAATYQENLTNCTMTSNQGGGMDRGVAVNCVIWGNQNYDTSEGNVSFSCMGTETTGTGNVTGDPGFVNLNAGDLRLHVESPCVDTGSPVGAPAKDLLDRVRPSGKGVDMGAYEFYPGDDNPSPSPPSLRVRAASTAAVPDGLTWETAFPTLEQAVDKAIFGTELWVAGGTYTAASRLQVV